MNPTLGHCISAHRAPIRIIVSLVLATFAIYLPMCWLARSTQAATIPYTFSSNYTQDLDQISDLDIKTLNTFISNDPGVMSYSGGVWTNPGPACWSCYDSAATAAAILARRGGGYDPVEGQVAIDTVNHAIARYQQSDGSFRGADGPVAYSVQPGTGETTSFYTFELGVTYLELAPKLDATTRANWASAIARACNYLIKSGDTTWYINGNVQLRQTLDLWLAWKATGNSSFFSAYNDEYAFTTAPNQQRWPGFGLHVTKAPTRTDGSDGAGFLGEAKQPSAPGWDPYYSMLQTDTAEELWVLTREPRYLRLLNLLYNQEATRLNSIWTLDATGGTRKNNVFAFTPAAAEILYSSGDRPDLQPGLVGHLTRITKEYLNPSNWKVPNFYMDLSDELSVILLERQLPNGAAYDPTAGAGVSRSAGSLSAKSTSVSKPISAARSTSGSPPVPANAATVKVISPRAGITKTQLRAGLRVLIRGAPYASRIVARLYAGSALLSTCKVMVTRSGGSTGRLRPGHISHLLHSMRLLKSLRISVSVELPGRAIRVVSRSLRVR